MPPSAKPLASLSLDLDNKWSYLKTHGEPGWDRFPTYLDILVPRVVEILEAHRLPATMFVVGQDAVLPASRDALAMLARSGHEIGNHSFHHEPWWIGRPRPEIEAELDRAHDAIASATGIGPIGFRGPGYSLSPAILHALARRGYLYDSSTFPTVLGPVSRAYYFRVTRSRLKDTVGRQKLFGTLRDGLRPLKPYRWQTEAGTLIEIPATTMPLLRVPFHLTYVLYLAGYGRRLAVQYFRAALALCRWTATPVSLLLHPIDFLGHEDAPDLAFYPTMSMARARKLEILGELLDMFAKEFRVVPLREHARDAARTPLPSSTLSHQ